MDRSCIAKNGALLQQSLNSDPKSYPLDLIYSSGKRVLSPFFGKAAPEVLLHHGPLLITRISLIPAWLNNHINDSSWDKFADPFPNVNVAAVEFWEWISNLLGMW